MTDLRYVNKILKSEKYYLILKKKSEVGFWNFQFFGILSILLNKDKDYLIITENRILYVFQSKLVKDV
jgi:hypothetical protein